MRFSRSLYIFVILLFLLLMAQTGPCEEYRAPIPAGLPESLYGILIPPDNPMTTEKVDLGKKLYFDKRLSVDDTVSCATCHDPALGFADGKPVGEGIQGKKGARNSPTVLNSMFNVDQFWDGRAKSLEEQARGPLINPVEMAMPSHDAVAEKVRGISEYGPAFEKAFGPNSINIDNIAKAIASFERTQLSGNSAFDRFVAGQQDAISESARRGFELFKGKARCITCHEFNPTNAFFTDYKFHNIGVGMKASANFEPLARQVLNLAQEGKLTEQELDKLSLTEGFSELGRFMVSRQPKDVGAFKTSTLRDIELTAPYMHDGSQKTLKEVIEFYNKGGEPNPNLDGGIRKLDLTETEIDDLVEYMKTLTGDRAMRLARGEEKLF